MKKITAYKCSHCGRILEDKEDMIFHEKRCYKNPDNTMYKIWKYEEIENENI